MLSRLVIYFVHFLFFRLTNYLHQDEVIPHLEPGMVPSTIDPDATGYVERANKSKKAVKISAWKLAKLDSNEAIRAAAKARASSSVLRPIDPYRAPDADFSYSDNASVRSSLSVDYSATKESLSEAKLSPLRNTNLPSLASKEDFETSTQSASSLSSPAHFYQSAAPSTIPLQHPAVSRPPHPVPRGPPATQLTNPMFQSTGSVAWEHKKTCVVWDQEAGRFVSVPASTGMAGADVHARRTSRISLGNRSADTSTNDRRSDRQVTSPVLPPVSQERIMYTGRSIFFGGPLFNEPFGDAMKHESSSSVTRKSDKEWNAINEERGGK